MSPITTTTTTTVPSLATILDGGTPTTTLPTATTTTTVPQNVTPTSQPTTTTTTPTSSAPTTPTSAVTPPSQGNFPQTPNETPYGTFDSPIIPKMSVPEFQSHYGIPSTDMYLYEGVDANGNPTGTLGPNAAYLAIYKSMSRAARQEFQGYMQAQGLIPSQDANGLDNAASLIAFKNLMVSTQGAGTSMSQWISQAKASSTPLAQVQNTIANQLATAQKNATTGSIVTNTNPSTLAAAINNAFEQALGYAPSAAQTDAFVKGIQGQETTYGEAPRTEAKAQIAQLHSEQSSLNSLGANGIDSVIQAYQKAISGSGIPGVGTQQGPVNGLVSTSPSQQGLPAPGTVLPSGDAFRYTPSGVLVGSNLLPMPDGTKQVTVPAGGVQGAANAVENWGLHAAGGLPGNASIPQQTTTKTVPAFSPIPRTTFPAMPETATNTKPTHGGIYALSPLDWQNIQKLFPAAKQFPTAGDAPLAIQHAGFTALLTDAYDKNGNSWSKAIASIASGSPFGKNEGSHLSAFGNSIASDVTNQINALQQQVNNSAVTVKVSQPDINAEAAQAAQSADPVGYYAANAASWGNVLNQMLTGAPQMYGATNADTFSGPVPTYALGSSSSATGTG